MKEPITIAKNQNLLPSEDYVFLRKKGMELIEQLGSDKWTDYNITDSGIAIFENAIFAKTEMGYRLGFPITDFLANALNKGGFDQAFYSAAEILTTSPITISDYRRLLIDQKGIRNAWLITKDCACEMPLFKDCLNSQLVYTFNSLEEGIVPKGMYDILLDFEEDPTLGSLNDGKLFSKLYSSTDFVSADLEIRFPIWQEVLNRFEDFEHFLDLSKTIKTITASIFNANNLPLTDANLAKSIQQAIKVNFEIEFNGIVKKLVLSNVPINVFLEKSSDKNAFQLLDFKDFTEEKGSTGIINIYRQKLKKIQEVITATKSLLHRFRNLDEDFCNFTEVGVEDVAVCADIVVSPEADIEKVQAQIYFEIEQYFNPAIRFYSLQELIEKKIPTEEIFNGPFLEHGFILPEDLENSQLKAEIRASDIINRLMDIEGVLAVQNFLMTKYDRNGNAILPSQAWKLPISSHHRPQLYIQRSKFLFFKNELPFLPANNDEVMATLQQLKSTFDSYKLQIHENNLPLPTGMIRDFEDYFPIQFQFPINYGIGFEGLPRESSDLRKAQSKQLKAYLLLFEQILANGFSQMAHFDQVFSLDEAVTKTIFTKFIDENLLAISSIDDVANYKLYVPSLPVFDANELDKLAESEEEKLLRRNKFLDHLLARFGESFTEYALLMTELSSESDDYFTAKKISYEKLIKDKIRFLKDYPLMSREKAKAFNYLDEVKVEGLQNIAGLKRRIAHLLGQEMLRNHIKVEISIIDKKYWVAISLVKENGDILLKHELPSAETSQKANDAAQNLINEWIAFIVENPPKTNAFFDGTHGFYQLKNHQNIVIGISKEYVDLATAQTALADTIIWAKSKLKFERFFIIEHLLLRPRFYGEALLPVCLDADCETCGEDDPYSFRLTFVMPGWMPKFKNINFRRYAERIIRTETPAHLLPKICWVGNEIYRGHDASDGIICKILALLKAEYNGLALSADPTENDILLTKLFCPCADFIFEKYNEAYAEAVFNNNFLDISLAEKNAIYDQFIKQNLICKTQLKPTHEALLKTLLSNYFKTDTCKIQLIDDEEITEAKLQCFQMNAIHKAWNEWVIANKAILSNFEPQLHYQFENYLKAFALKNNLVFNHDDACLLIRQILGEFGEKLRLWILLNYDQTITDAQWESQIVTLIEAALTKFLITNPKFSDLRDITVEYYTDKANGKKKHKKDVMFKHAKLLAIFNKLKSIYPPATLHDCEDGDDGLVVRLDNTVII